MSAGEQPNLERLFEVPVVLSAQMGSTRRSIQDILRLRVGSVLVLDADTSSPVVLYANGKAFARGEIVVTGRNFGLQVTALGLESGNTDTSPQTRNSGE